MYFSQSLPLSLALAGAAMAKTIVVEVSNASGDIVYNPSSVKADVGDIVQYNWINGEHSVSESTFESPCAPASSGFNSGFLSGGSDTPTFSYKVADTNPHYFYCAEGKHCQNGMVGIINPGKNDVASFASAAKNAKSGTPNENVAGGVVGSLKAGTGVSSAAGSSAAASTTAAPASSSAAAAAGNSSSAASSYATSSYYYSSGAVYTSAIVFTSNGQVQTTQAVATATGAAAAQSSVKAAGAGRAVAGVAAAAGAVAAMIL